MCRYETTILTFRLEHKCTPRSDVELSRGQMKADSPIDVIDAGVSVNFDRVEVLLLDRYPQQANVDRSERIARTKSSDL